MSKRWQQRAHWFVATATKQSQPIAQLTQAETKVQRNRKQTTFDVFQFLFANSFRMVSVVSSRISLFLLFFLCSIVLRFAIFSQLSLLRLFEPATRNGLSWKCRLIAWIIGFYFAFSALATTGRTPVVNFVRLIVRCSLFVTRVLSFWVIRFADWRTHRLLKPQHEEYSSRRLQRFALYLDVHAWAFYRSIRWNVKIKRNAEKPEKKRRKKSSFSTFLSTIFPLLFRLLAVLVRWSRLDNWKWKSSAVKSDRKNDVVDVKKRNRLIGSDES